MSLSFTYLDPEKIMHSSDFDVVQDFLKMTNRTNIGWHYVVDLAWIYSNVKNWPKNYRVLDAGGGHGPVQFLMAELGFDVVNIDLLMAKPKYEYMKRYKTSLHKLDSHEETLYTQHLYGVRKYRALARSLYSAVNESILFRDLLSMLYNSKHNRWQSNYNKDMKIGKISWAMGNLCAMPEIDDSSFDAVVSLSSLEHIPLKNLDLAVKEIGRILKPDAKYAITTSATHKKESWFHEPSKGLCFSGNDLEKIFNAQSRNELSAEEVLFRYKNCKYLENNLAKFYSRSAENGMPWGKWEPKYLPVGIWS